MGSPSTGAVEHEDLFLKKKKINVILFPEGEKFGIQFLNVCQEHDLCHVWTMQKGLG